LFERHVTDPLLGHRRLPFGLWRRRSQVQRRQSNFYLLGTFYLIVGASATCRLDSRANRRAGCNGVRSRPAQPRNDGTFAMSQRFKPLSQHDMTLDQQRVAQAVASGPRGGLRGPFHALLRSPELADRVRHLGDYVRFESTVPAALRELAILLVARFWSAHYEWNAHRRHAAAAGLDPSIADAIEMGKRPAKLTADEALVYDLVAELLHDKD